MHGHVWAAKSTVQLSSTVKIMTTQRVHCIFISNRNWQRCTPYHSLCLHTHLYRQTQTHKGGQTFFSWNLWRGHLRKKTGHTNFHNYLATQNSLYALYHPKPSTTDSLPQYVTAKMQASYISEICISHISELKWLVNGHPHVVPNLHDFLLWNTNKIFWRMFYDLTNFMN